MYSTLEKTNILKSVVLFSATSAETLTRVARMAEEVSYPAGSLVYHEGEPGKALYVVASGTLRATSGSAELAVLRRGDPFGEIAVLNRNCYRASVTAVDNSVVLRIEQADMFDLIQDSSDIMQGVISLLARRVVQVGGQFSDVYSKSA